MLPTKNIIGWKEWCALPDLDLPAVKAKIDTGAKTSALHAYNIKKLNHNGVDYVSFDITPLQRHKNFVVNCRAPLVGFKLVTSSNGEQEKRFVIETKITLGDNSFSTEITLTSRHKMTYKMLLGRDALRTGKFIVDPVKAYNLGKIKKPESLYNQ